MRDNSGIIRITTRVRQNVIHAMMDGVAGRTTLVGIRLASRTMMVDEMAEMAKGDIAKAKARGINLAKEKEIIEEMAKEEKVKLKIACGYAYALLHHKVVFGLEVKNRVWVRVCNVASNKFELVNRVWVRVCIVASSSRV